MLVFTTSIPPMYLPVSHGKLAMAFHAVPMLQRPSQSAGVPRKGSKQSANLRNAAWVTACVFAVTSSCSS